MASQEATIAAVLILLLSTALTEPVQWQVRPYGPDVWAVSKTYGGDPHWSRQPGDAMPEPREVIACKEVPSKHMAEVIAEALNKREKKE